MGIKDKLKAKFVILFLKGKLPMWVYRMAGRKAAEIIKLEDNMETKKPWQSKAVWTAVIGVVLGAIPPVSEALGHPVVVPNWVFQVLGAFGLYALRTGSKPIV